MKLSESAFANASALFMGILYLFCALAVILFPGFSKAVSISWFHGIDLGAVWTGSIRGNFLLGLVSAVVLSWIGGYIFAKAYNYFLKK